ncbi:MAG TPA: MarR family winged helix-turn-helix transcriptional regulator [Demequinaceae bacterium]
MFEMWIPFAGPPLVPAGDDAPLIRALLGTARCVGYACDARASGAHMSAVQAQLAAQLARSPGGLPSSTLAERLGVTKQAITGLVDRMEYAGLVLRTEHPLDGRCTLVRLTEHGASEFVGVARRLAAFNRELELRLGPDRDAQLKHLLWVITEGAADAGIGCGSHGVGGTPEA